MKTETKILAVILTSSIILVFGAIFFFGRTQDTNKGKVQGATYRVDQSIGHKMGSDSAKLKLVEFSDFQCPACKGAEPTVKEIITSHPDEVQLIYRHFPLPQHKNAIAAATFSEIAAEQNKFWQVHDALFATQENWSELTDPADFFIDLARKNGVDENYIKDAIKNDLYQDKIDKDLNEGKALNVSSTPTFFLNGQKLDLQSFESLKSIIEQQLKNN